MCDHPERLIAWLDGELLPSEADAIGRHVDACGACGEQVLTYQRTNAELKAYCVAMMEAKVRHPVPTWLWGVAAVTAIAAVVLTVSTVLPGDKVELPRRPVRSVAVQMSAQRDEPTVTETPRPIAAPAGRSSRAKHLEPLRPSEMASPERPGGLNWSPTESAIAITIPAEALFPPEVVPEGVSFNAELSIATDGSPAWLWLRP